jgi:transcriptional regulator with XRE-family HTH domain
MPNPAAGRTKKAEPSPRPKAKRAVMATDDKPSESTVLALARQVRGWADSVLGIAGAAADVSYNVAKSMLPKPEQKAALEKAGSVVRGMREAAGLSIAELGQAINLKDPGLLELVEHGKVALPFEIILRLASVLGRNDPIPFVMKLTRTYNPDVWQTLENLGIGRLVLQVGREREIVNIYRANDAARRLSDEDFAAILAFTKSAFDMALAFRLQGRKPRASTKSAPTPE